MVDSVCRTMAHHARAAAGRRALPLLPVVRLVLPAEEDALLLLLRLVPFGDPDPDPGRPPCRERRAESAAAIVL